MQIDKNPLRSWEKWEYITKQSEIAYDLQGISAELSIPRQAKICKLFAKFKIDLSQGLW